MALKGPADAALKKRGSKLDVSQKAVGAFRTISEVSRELDVPQHVLRFWETKFTQIRPMKRGGGRRYYRPDDIKLLRRIRDLLYSDGYTIKGVQKLLKTVGEAATKTTETATEGAAVQEDDLRLVLQELEAIRDSLRAAS